jgi:hypothetical protein
MNENRKSEIVYLSKSLFMRGLQCHKSLYLQKFRPELKDEISEETQWQFDMGTKVGSLAQQLFPGGAIVPYEGLSHSEQISMTQALIEQGRETIYEAAFSYNDFFIKADILRHGNDGWEIYEVKSSSSVGEYHYNDASVQYHIVYGTGLPVTKVCLVYINKDYVRHGEIEVQKLFKIVDITQIALEKRPFIAEEIQKQQTMLKGDEPVIDIGPQCESPYVCDFKGYCWSHIPSPSVFNFRGVGRPDGFSLYQKGIVKMEEVPAGLLGWRQKMQLDGLLQHKNYVDVNALNAFTITLWYPLCFMDFETTLMVPIPMYDDTRPYQQVTFQFSLHIMHEPGGELEHHEFLADGATNPQKEFIDRLLAAVPRNACILVWNSGFESSRLKELAEAFPEKKEDIDQLIKNIRDLMVPFRRGSFYHWQFNGSYSIKNVLPALVPELSYDNLEIKNGGMASSSWLRMIQSNDDEEKSTIRKQLLKYCGLDTLAMVKILEKISNV